ncbi:MAG TPA: hypothetical protein DCW29_05845 [Janthinobacterium sp.]|nr:hypothetical protein [Janthinobacterium sp.]
MSILNFTANDLKQINSRAIERLRSQDNHAEVKHAKVAKPAADIVKIVRYGVGDDGIVEVQGNVPEKDASVVIISPSSTAANFSKKHIRYVFKVAKKKLRETE